MKVVIPTPELVMDGGEVHYQGGRRQYYGQQQQQHPPSSSNSDPHGGDGRGVVDDGELQQPQPPMPPTTPQQPQPSSSFHFQPRQRSNSLGPPSRPPPRRVDHTYRDYSKFPVNELPMGKKPPTNFPSKLHQILSTPEYAHIISWMPHGRAWQIHKKDLLVREVIPKYFVQSKYESFTRQLNGWGLKRLHQSGNDYNAYYHECFLRGMPHLVVLMKRVLPNQGKLLPHVEGEPNFYEIEKQFPLPQTMQYPYHPHQGHYDPYDPFPQFAGGTGAYPGPPPHAVDHSAHQSHYGSSYPAAGGYPTTGGYPPPPPPYYGQQQHATAAGGYNPYSHHPPEPGYPAPFSHYPPAAHYGHPSPPQDQHYPHYPGSRGPPYSAPPSYYDNPNTDPVVSMSAGPGTVHSGEVPLTPTTSATGTSRVVPLPGQEGAIVPLPIQENESKVESFELLRMFADSENVDATETVQSSHNDTVN